MNCKETIYLDNAATTPLDRAVLEKMMPWLRDHYANPSSAHPLGQQVRQAIEDARGRIGTLLGAAPTGVIFTSGGTESNNLIIRGLAAGRKKSRIITTRLEHPSVSESAALLAARGFDVVSPSNDSSGRIDLNHLEDLLREAETLLLCVIHGSNEVGTVQDAATIGQVVRSASPRTWFHLDSVQSIGCVDFEPARWGIDSCALSAHKLFGPKGSGILTLYRDTEIEPLLAGGGQERNRRSGTENPAAIIGAAEALALAIDARVERTTRTDSLRTRLKAFIESEISDVRVNENGAAYLPHILSVSFAGLLGEVLLHHLEREGVMVSAGSACHAADSSLSEAILALGVSSRLARGTIRFSFSHLITDDEIDRTCTVLAEQVAFLREVGIP